MAYAEIERVIEDTDELRIVDEIVFTGDDDSAMIEHAVRSHYGPIDTFMHRRLIKREWLR